MTHPPFDQSKTVRLSRLAFNKLSAPFWTPKTVELLVGKKHDLADMFAAFHPPVGLGGLSEREGGVDDRAHLPRFQTRPDLLPKLVGEGGLESDRAGPKGGAGEGEAP